MHDNVNRCMYFVHKSGFLMPGYIYFYICIPNNNSFLSKSWRIEKLAISETSYSSVQKKGNSCIKQLR